MNELGKKFHTLAQNKVCRYFKKISYLTIQEFNTIMLPIFVSLLYVWFPSKFILYFLFKLSSVQLLMITFLLIIKNKDLNNRSTLTSFYLSVTGKYFMKK